MNYKIRNALPCPNPCCEFKDSLYFQSNSIDAISQYPERHIRIHCPCGVGGPLAKTEDGAWLLWNNVYKNSP